MKKKYEKPVIFSEDISVTFAGACCTEESPIGWNPQYGALKWCIGECHFELNAYQA